MTLNPNDSIVFDADADFEPTAVSEFAQSADALFADTSFDVASETRIAAKDAPEPEYFTEADKKQLAKKRKTAPVADVGAMVEKLQKKTAAAKTAKAAVEASAGKALKVKAPKATKLPPQKSKEEILEEKRLAKAQMMADRKAQNAANAAIVKQRKEEARAQKAAERAAAAIVAPIDYVLPEMYKIESYVEAVALAQELADRGSNSNFELGWLFLGIPTEYGDKTLQHVAKEIGMAVGTANKIRWVAACWSPDDVKRFPRLKFSHFQAVTKVAVNMGKEAAQDFLFQANEGPDGNPMSVEQLNKLISGEKPKTKKDNITLAGGTFFIARSVADFERLFQTGRIFMGAFTDLDGTYEDQASKAGLMNEHVKLNVKATPSA